MGSRITVRGIDQGDKSGLRCEARRRGVSMEELVRRLIREKRTETQRRLEAIRNLRTAFRSGA